MQTINHTSNRLFTSGLQQVRRKLNSNGSLEEILNIVIKTIEEKQPDLIASILLLKGTQLFHGAATGLPQDYCNAIDGIMIGPEAGSCGAAAYLQTRVIIDDIETHPNWEHFKALAVNAGLQACWSQPILSSEGSILGTFALYYKEKKAPSIDELELLEAASELAGIAIELKQAEDALEAARSNITTLTEAMPQIVWSTLPDGYHDYYNKRWFEFTGANPDDTQGEGWNPQFHPDDQDRAWRLWKHSLATGDPYEIEYRLRAADGSYRWFLGRALPVYNESGQITRWYGTCTDIQAQKDAEEALQQQKLQLLESEEKFRMVAESIPQLAWMTDDTGYVYWYNQRWYDYTGSTLEEMEGWGWKSIQHPDHVDRVEQYFKLALKIGVQWEDIFPLRSKHGEWRWFLSRALPLRDREGKITRWFGSNTDITEQLEAKQEQEWQNKLLSMIAYAQNLFFSTQDIYKVFEEPLQQLLSLTQSEYGFIGEILQTEEGKPYLKCCFITNIGWNDEVRNLWEATKATGFEFHKLDNLFGEVITSGKVVISNEPDEDPRKSKEGRPQGHPPLNAFLGIPLYKNDKLVGMIGIANKPGGYNALLVEKLQPFTDACSNIIETYRSKVEHEQLNKELSESEQRFRTLSDASPMMIWMLDTEAKLVYSNQAWHDFSGINLALNEDTDWKTLVHPDDIDLTINVVTEAYEYKKKFEVERRVRRIDGEYRWLYTVGVPRYTGTDEFAGFVGSCFDITERRELKLELERLVDYRTTQLTATNKELEAFCYSVSHDLRAPLRGIDGFSQALLEDYEDQLDQTGKQFLVRVRQESQRMGQLIEDLLRLSRVTRSELQLTPLDLTAMAKDIMASLVEMEPNRLLEVNIESHLQTEGDHALIQAALQNLFSNAFKFTSKAPSSIIQFGSLTENHKTVFYIRDNGVGFNMDYVDKVFATFQRLHPNSEFPGTGIGLATVQRIIHKHGGEIWADSVINKGTTFYFTLS